MLDPPLFEEPWMVALLLAGGALLVAGLAWLLGRAHGRIPLADELGELAWVAIRHVRRVFVLLGAATLAIAGVALLVLPGPGTLLLAGALGLLATEFVWARRWIKRMQTTLAALGQDARDLWNGGRGRRRSGGGGVEPRRAEPVAARSGAPPPDREDQGDA
jgi:hypothetical protein